MQRGTAEFTRRTLIVLLLVGLAYIAWRLAQVWLLVFGGVILAIVLRELSYPICKYLHIPRRWAVLIVVLMVLLLIFGLGWLFGGELALQLTQIWDRLPAALDRLNEWAADLGIAQQITDALRAALRNAQEILLQAAGYAMAVVSAISGLLLIIFAAIYFAMDSKSYSEGILRLLPPNQQQPAKDALNDAHKALRGWLGGMAIDMVAVGVMTWVGLWIAGVPLAFGLAVLSGISVFVPIVGPLVAAIPGILIALTESWTTGLWAAIVYVIVQQIEGNLIVPVVQSWAVSLPAVLTLFAIVVFGLLFGFLGAILAAPLAVALKAIIERLYVRNTLEEES